MPQDCFDWRSCVRAYSEPGLSSCVEDGRLTLDGRRVASTTIDLYALRLIEWAVERNQSLVLCPPEPFGALPALAAASAHIASIVSHHAATGRAMGSNRRVAIVTTDPRMRGVYRRLGIGTASLFEVAPAAVRTASGALSVIGRDPGRGWSTVFLTRPDEVTRLDHIDLTVLELPVGDASEIEQLEGPLVLIARDPSDPMVVRLAEKLPVFAWSDADLTSLSELALVDGPALVEDRLRLERAAQGIRCDLLAIPEQRVCENAALFWADIGPLLRAARRSPFGRELAAAAFVLFYDLMHLAVPTAFYEAATRPLRARIREIEIAQRLTDGDLRDLYIPMIGMELQDLAAAITAEPKKSSAMHDLLRERAAEGADVLLVARTAEMARVYRAYVDSMDELDGCIRVASIRGIAEERPADVAVVAGLLPRWARYLYTTGIAAEIVALGYEVESPLEGVPDGFTEHRQMASALAYQVAYSEWLARDAAKSACWSALSGDPNAIPDEHPEPPEVRFDVAPDDREPARPPEVPPGLWDGAAGGFVEMERRLARGAAPRLSVEGSDEGLEIEAVRVEFGDGRWMYVDRESSVTRWISGDGRAEAGYSAARICPGDKLLLLDGEVRKDLLGKVLEVAEDVPELAASAAWVDYWRDALRRAHRTFGSYEALHDDLAGRGCTKQTQTVRLWVVGQTIGPEDQEDVRRLGECLGDEPLTENYRRVAEAMRSLRTAHQQLGRRLGELMRDVGGATAVGALDEDEIIDERTGLTASDFRDSIEIVTVASVRPADAAVPYVLTGSLRAADEGEAEIA